MSEPASNHPRLLRSAPLLAFLALQTAIIAVVHAHRTLWSDEFNLLITARKPLVEGLLWLQDYSAPLYQLSLRPFLSSDTPPAWLVRAPAFAFSLATVVAAWLFVKELFSRRAAAIALAFLVLDPLFALLSAQARPYTLFAFFSVASMGAFCAQLGARPRPWALAGWIASSVLLVYAHYYGLLLLAAQLAFSALELACTRDSRLARRLAAGFAAIAVLVLPALWLISRYVLSGAAGTVGWIPRPERTDLLFLRQSGILLGDELLTIVCLAAIAFSLARSDSPDSRRGWRPWWESHRAEMLCLLWIAFGLYFLVLVSYAMRPIYVSRYGLPVVVPLAAFLGAALARIRMPWQLAAVLALLSLPAARLLQLDLRPDARDYEHLIDALRVRNTDGSPLYVGDLPYLSDFVNTEVTGLRYYGYADGETETLLPLVRGADGQVQLRDGSLLPSDRRVFVLSVSGVGTPAIEAYLQGEGRAYRRSDFGALSLIELERTGTQGRWLSPSASPAQGDAPAPPRRTGE